MAGLTLSPQPEDFIWASGVEDTFVPQARPKQRPLEEYALMGHYEHWREDLALARDLGLRALRWGVPWYRVEPRPGEFDWRWTDDVIPYLVEDLNIVPIIDLLHYGCPLWLQREFANPDYPRAVASYAATFARRYAHLVNWYTPCNEPLVCALMCGKRGVWPPYRRGDRGYVRVLLQLARGILDTVQAIHEADPTAIMVHVEATGLTETMRQDLEPLAAEAQRRGYLSLDLLTGRVTPNHPLFPWLVQNGTSPAELEAIARRAISLDVLGMNFYPQWSTKHMDLDRRGRLVQRIVDRRGTGFARLIEDYYRRYTVPIFITETSAKGRPSARSDWLHASLAMVKELRGRGVPVHGYTWFPMFTMIDWKYRTGTHPLDSYRLDLGLFTLSDSEGQARWLPTPLVEQFQTYVDHPEEAIGAIAGPDPRRQASPIEGE